MELLLSLKRPVIFAVGFFKNRECKWHEDEYGYDMPDECGYPNCGTWKETKLCKGCGKFFTVRGKQGC